MQNTLLKSSQPFSEQKTKQDEIQRQSVTSLKSVSIIVKFSFNIVFIPRIGEHAKPVIIVAKIIADVIVRP